MLNIYLLRAMQSVCYIFLYWALWIIDSVIGITQLYYMLNYPTPWSIDWCHGFVTNLVVIIQITQLLILEFHLNLKEPMPKGYLFFILAKVLLQKASINSAFIIINLLIFVAWIIEIYGSLDCLTSSSINWCGAPTMNWGCFNYSYYKTSYLRASWM